MKKEIEMEIKLRVCFVSDVDNDDAENTIKQALCDAGNAMIGDDLGDGTKIELVSF